jgi:glycosyltransferase involved in cell wall biosynthesis
LKRSAGNPVDADSTTRHDAMRIALFTQQISHYHAARYRAARAVIAKVRVLSLVNGADFQEFLSRDCGDADTIRVFEGREAYAAAVRSGALWKRIHDELASFAPEVVVVAGWSFPESLAAISWARRAGSRVVVMSESQRHDAGRGTLREALKRRVVSACDAALVGAEPHAQYAVELGIPRDRVMIGYDAVDNQHFSTLADKARAQAGAARSAHGLPRRHILACGRLVEKKNFHGLIGAFARAIREQDTGHDLVILGDGPEAARLRDAARERGLADRIHFPGFRGYDALPGFYGLADGFAHVATSEQWGLVVNEAAAAGVPLVVSRPTGAAALVHEGRNGFLVDPNDTADIARGLALVMRCSDDRRDEMRAESRRIVAACGTERFASGLSEACAAALRQPPRRLAIWDRILLRLLARTWIDKVQ